MTINNQVLFLCTGNYYRSRYAEELFNHRAKLESLQWRAFSRGVAKQGFPSNVGPMSRFALEALQAKRVVPERAANYPQPCSLADFDQAGSSLPSRKPSIGRTLSSVSPRLQAALLIGTWTISRWSIHRLLWQ
jgi:hypothetical protein